MGKLLVHNFVQFSFKDKGKKYVRLKRDLKLLVINQKTYERLILMDNVQVVIILIYV